MSIQAIEKKILEQAQAEADKIKQDSQTLINELEQVHERDTRELTSKAREHAEQKAAAAKRAILVPARLAARKSLLEAKQKIIGSLYKEIKKEKKLSQAELENLREKSEAQAAAILFNIK